LWVRHRNVHSEPYLIIHFIKVSIDLPTQSKDCTIKCPRVLIGTIMYLSFRQLPP